MHHFAIEATLPGHNGKQQRVHPFTAAMVRFHQTRMELINKGKLAERSIHGKLHFRNRAATV